MEVNIKFNFIFSCPKDISKAKLLTTHCVHSICKGKMYANSTKNEGRNWENNIGFLYYMLSIMRLVNSRL